MSHAGQEPGGETGENARQGDAAAGQEEWRGEGVRRAGERSGGAEVDVGARGGAGEGGRGRGSG